MTLKVLQEKFLLGKALALAQQQVSSWQQPSPLPNGQQQLAQVASGLSQF